MDGVASGTTTGRDARRTFVARVVERLPGLRGLVLTQARPVAVGGGEVIGWCADGENELLRRLEGAGDRSAQAVWSGNGVKDPPPGLLQRLSTHGVVTAVGVDPAQLDEAVRDATEVRFEPLSNVDDAANLVTLLSANGIVIVEWQVAANVLRLDPAFVDSLGPTAIARFSDALLAAIFRTGVAGGRIVTEVELARTNGLRTFDVRLARVVGEKGGAATIWRGTLVDVTAERARARDDARRLGLMRAALAAAGSDGFELDLRAGTMTREGATWGPVGWTRPDVNGGRPDRFIPLDDGNGTESLARRLEALGDRPFEAEWEARDASGARRRFLLRGRPSELDADGKPIRWVGGNTDVTELRRAAESLAASEAQFRTLADAAPVGVFVCDPEGRTTYVNPAFVEVFATAPQALLGEGWLERVLPSDRDLVEILRTPVDPAAPDVRIEFGVPRLDGVRTVEVHGRALPSADGRLRRFGILVDHTDRKAAERRVAESEVRFRLLAEASPMGVYLSRADGFCEYANPRLAEIFGKPVADLLGYGWMQQIHADDRPRLRQERDARVPGQRPARQVLAYRIDTPHGVRELRVHTTEVEREGEVLLVGILSDVTDELRREERLRDLQRLESIGLLAGGIAHDFNNLLATILGNATLVREDLGTARPEAAESLEDLIAAAKRARDLTTQLLAYAGKGRVSTVRVDLANEVSDMVRLLGAVLRPLDVQLRLSPGTVVRADRSQVQQVVMNLLTNAAEAMSGRPGTLSIGVGREVPDGTPGAPPLAFVEVSDAGIGMDEDTRRRMFDPFFTTKATGHGLGLAAVQGIVRTHGGSIDVRSAPGHGTTVRVLLPAVEGDSDPGRTPPPVSGTHLRPGVFLVIDDDKPVRRVVERILQSAGHTVHVCDSGADALALLPTLSPPPEVALIDLLMPGLDGPETASRLRATAPTLTLVATSGFGKGEAESRFGALGLAGSLRKPFTAAELLATIEDALARARSLPR